MKLKVGDRIKLKESARRYLGISATPIYLVTGCFEEESETDEGIFETLLYYEIKDESKPAYVGRYSFYEENSSFILKILSKRDHNHPLTKMFV